MSETDASLIYTGFWIDESSPGILGSRWTVKQEYANVVVALVAILVSIGVGSAWSLLLFFFHQSRATADPRDCRFRQQQVLLRSLGSPGSVCLESIKLILAWADYRPQTLLRGLIPAVLGVLFVIGGLAAGVFSSAIVSSTSLRVLVDSPDCQQLNMTSYLRASPAATVVLDNKVHNMAYAYAEQCYGSETTPSQCNSYVSPRIQVNSSFGQTPFQNSTMHDSNRALLLDSGYLDSNDIFGINAKPRDRVQIRRKATCAPLDPVSHTSVVDPALDPQAFISAVGRNPIPGEMLTLVRYGSQTSGLAAVYNASEVRSTLLSNASSRYCPTGNRAYSSPNLTPYNTIHFIDDLVKTKADVTAIIIHTGATTSLHPIDDPVYSAHKASLHTNNGHDNVTLYRSDRPLGVMGCIEQYEYCIPNSASDAGLRTCTDMSGARDSGFEELLPSANEKQLATLEHLGTATVYTGLVNAATHGVLNSTYSYGANDWLPALPADQWIFDVQSMEAFVLAELQILIAIQSQGIPTNEDSRTFLTQPASSDDPRSWLCHNQKVIKVSGFANIDLFAFAFVLAVTIALVTLDYGIVRILVHYNSPLKRSLPATRFWIADGLYQLQRAAYDARGIGVWSRSTCDVPRVENGALLESLSSFEDVDS